VRKAVSKFQLPEAQFERTDKDKIDCKTYFKLDNYIFKHIFEILI